MQHAVHRQTTLIIDVQFKGNSACLVLLPVGDENVIALFTIFSQVHFHYVSTSCHMLCDPDNYRTWHSNIQIHVFTMNHLKFLSFAEYMEIKLWTKIQFPCKIQFSWGFSFRAFSGSLEISIVRSHLREF